MGIFEEAQVFGLGRIGSTNLAGFNGQVGLSKAAARKKIIVCRSQAQDGTG